MPRFPAATIVVLVGLLGCASGKPPASSRATYRRFELSSAAHPESVSSWYRCFAHKAEEYRKLCLASTPGVHVAEGPALQCESSPADLCRSFAVRAPEYQGASTVDDDNAGAAIGKALGQLVVALTAPFRS